MDHDRVPRWEAMTTREAEALAGEDPVVILPLAAIEQHGPHLPLSTDLDIGMGILENAFGHLPEGFPARVLPAQAVGTSTEHIRFPGTLSLPAELLGAVIHEVSASLARHGVRRLLLCNSHGGNRPVLDAAGVRLREEHGLLVVRASYMAFPRPTTVTLPDAEWTHGLHGGAVETAMLLHLRPERVRTGEIRRAPSLGEELEETMRRLGPEGAVPFSWLASDLNRSGVVGDASLANPSMGARLVDHYGKLLAEVIRDARAFPLERLG